MPVAIATASLKCLWVPTQGFCFFFQHFGGSQKHVVRHLIGAHCPILGKIKNKSATSPYDGRGNWIFGFLKLSKPLAPLKYKLELQNLYEINYLGCSYFAYNKKSDMLLSFRDIPEKGFYMAPLWATMCIDHTNECDWSSSVQTQTVSSLAKARCNQKD